MDEKENVERDDESDADVMDIDDERETESNKTTNKNDRLLFQLVINFWHEFVLKLCHSILN